MFTKCNIPTNYWISMAKRNPNFLPAKEIQIFFRMPYYSIWLLSSPTYKTTNLITSENRFDLAISMHQADFYQNSDRFPSAFIIMILLPIFDTPLTKKICKIKHEIKISTFQSVANSLRHKYMLKSISTNSILTHPESHTLFLSK